MALSTICRPKTLKFISTALPLHTDSWKSTPRHSPLKCHISMSNLLDMLTTKLLSYHHSSLLFPQPFPQRNWTLWYFDLLKSETPGPFFCVIPDFFFSLTCHPTHLKILSVLSWKYIWNLMLYCHSHCCHPGPNHHYLSPGIHNSLLTGLFLPSFLYSHF